MRRYAIPAGLLAAFIVAGVSALNEYDFAETVKMTGTFKVAGAVTDPTTITLTVVDPSGDSTSYTYAASQLTKDSTGVYSKSIALSEAGEWSYTFTGTGTAAGVETKRLAIRRSGA